MTANALHLSTTSQWYTPPDIIKVVRQVLRTIDLDPASCALANKTVGATRFFNGILPENDGLKQPWNGHVFCNPPYSVSDGGPAGLWTKKAIEEHKAGRTKEGILLLNATPSAGWFYDLWAFPICFLYKRIHFLDSEGNPSKSPTHGNCMVYLGPASGLVVEPSGHRQNATYRFADLTKTLGHTVFPRN